jgi:hypothetical protein
MMPCGFASVTQAVSIRRVSAAEPSVYIQIDLETLWRARCSRSSRGGGPESFDNMKTFTLRWDVAGPSCVTPAQPSGREGEEPGHNVCVTVPSRSAW